MVRLVSETVDCNNWAKDKRIRWKVSSFPISIVHPNQSQPNRQNWSAANHAQNVNIVPFTKHAKLQNADTHTHKTEMWGKFCVRFRFVSYRLSLKICLFSNQVGRFSGRNIRFGIKIENVSVHLRFGFIYFFGL